MKQERPIHYWLALSICFLILIASITYYLSNSNQRSTSSYQMDFTNLGFDTSITFQAQCTQSEFDNYVSILSGEYQRYNKLFDAYHEYDGIANLCTINKEAYDHEVTTDPELISLIKTSMEFNAKDNKFDCTQGDLLDLWHTYREQGIEQNANGEDGNLPSQEEIEDAIQHGGNDKVVLTDSTIRFLDSETKIDLGGVAKGYATQKVKEKLEEAGLSSGLINAGGNVVLIGHKDSGSWQIGIQDPDSNSSLLKVETTNSIALVTSGDYQRYYTVDGTRYAHIIDPQSGYPPNYHRSVTILTSDSTLADLLSTALFCMSQQDGEALIKESYPDVGVVWIDSLSSTSNEPDLETKDLAIYVTDNIKDQVSLNE